MAGFSVPVHGDDDEVRRAVARLGETVGRILDATRMTEDELATMFDLRRPPK